MNNRMQISSRLRTLNPILIFAVMVLASCSSKPEGEAGKESLVLTPAEGLVELSKTQFETSEMKLGKLEMRDFHEMVKANGMFDVPPANKAEVSCYFGGAVKDIQLLTGERVTKGQVLFVLENPEYLQFQQDYLEAKNQLTYLKSDYDRQKNLSQDNVTSQKNYLKAESDYMVTKVKMESLGRKLSLININPTTLTLDNMRSSIEIYAPISGYVTDVAVTRGVFLNPSETAVAIVNTDHLHIELNIFEKDLPSIQVGQAIQFRIQQDQSKTYKGSVYLVNRTIKADRTIGVHCHLDDEKLAERFSPGMYVEAEIFTSSTSRWSLPQDALVEAEGMVYALVLESATDAGYTFVKTEVKTGISDHGYTEILNAKDFKEHTQFLINGTFNLITN